MVVTDGTTNATALIAKTAANQLREATGLSLAPDEWSTGDLIDVLESEVVMLPDFELVIVQLEYQWTWRKRIGQPSPLQDRAGFKKLLADIEEVRDIDPIERPVRPTPRAAPPPTSSSPAPPSASKQSPQPQSQIVPATQPAAATPLRRRHHVPTLAEDGFEMETGVNLARPVSLRDSTGDYGTVRGGFHGTRARYGGAMRGYGGNRSDWSRSRQASPADTTKLLEVLGNNKKNTKEKVSETIAAPKHVSCLFILASDQTVHERSPEAFSNCKFVFTSLTL